MSSQVISRLSLDNTAYICYNNVMFFRNGDNDMNDIKKIIAVILAALLLSLPLTSCNAADEKESEAEKSTWEPHDAPTAKDIDISKLENLDGVSESATETDYVKITVKDYGDIIVRLYPDVAPLTVQNFKKLVSEKFYDGLIFHRVIKGFMIQGGDPLGTGRGGSAATVRGEFSENGFENNLTHRKGVISMARTANDMDSASSQFFICQKTSTDLDGSYAAFGYTVYGIEVVDAIVEVRTDTENKPKTDIIIESIRFVKVEQ